MVTNRNLHLHITYDLSCRMTPKNGAAFSFGLHVVNVYIADVPETRATKFGYADDLRLFKFDPSWIAVENDMSLFSSEQPRHWKKNQLHIRRGVILYIPIPFLRHRLVVRKKGSALYRQHLSPSASIIIGRVFVSLLGFF